MGNIIRIKEGGLPKAFDASKLRTNLQGGGNCLWIPKESVPVASKFINENGTYLAAAEGLHGFSTLNVNVTDVDWTRGHKNGKTYYVKNGTGETIKYTEIPEYIEVYDPYALGKASGRYKYVYQNGEPMDYSNLLVYAYDVDGNLFYGSNIWREFLDFPIKYFSASMRHTVLEYPKYMNISFSSIDPAYIPFKTEKRAKIAYKSPAPSMQWGDDIRKRECTITCDENVKMSLWISPKRNLDGHAAFIILVGRDDGSIYRENIKCNVHVKDSYESGQPGSEYDTDTKTNNKLFPKYTLGQHKEKLEGRGIFYAKLLCIGYAQDYDFEFIEGNFNILDPNSDKTLVTNIGQGVTPFHIIAKTMTCIQREYPIEVRWNVPNTDGNLTYSTTYPVVTEEELL